MAGDTRDTDGTQSLQPPNVTSGAAVPPADSMRPKTYETFSPPPNANALPEGSGLNTAGAHSSNPTLSEAVKTLRFEDFKQVYMYPCVRESLLNGIGGGFVMGGLRLIFGSPVFRACNWAVGTFCLGGIASYEYCLQKRRIEKANMKRAVEIIDQKKADREAKMQKAREERRKAKEEADRKAEEEEKRKNSWKFW